MSYLDTYLQKIYKKVYDSKNYTISYTLYLFVKRVNSGSLLTEDINSEATLTGWKLFCNLMCDFDKSFNFFCFSAYL